MCHEKVHGIAGPGLEVMSRGVGTGENMRISMSCGRLYYYIIPGPYELQYSYVTMGA